MLRKILFSAMFAVPFCSFAQQRDFVMIGGSVPDNVKLKDPETIVGQVLYDFTYISDTTNPDKQEKEILALDFSNNYSKFYSQTFSTSQSLMMAEVQKQIKDQQGSSNININARPPEGTRDVFLTDKKEEKVGKLTQFVRSIYVISDGKHSIDWDIQDSTKTIGGYTCQKAVGTSRGRQYVAWFTTDLPYGFGPRRLNGLPGLILEAYDISRRIVYTFKQYNAGTGTEVGIPEQSIAATEKEYEDMMTAFKANPNAALGGRMSPPEVGPAGGGGGGNVQVKRIEVTTGNAATGANKKVINFPIDLTK
jgi:GLPGLI family protein